ncbi:FAD-binding oxidoreductase [Jatrophihabitans fulvus]
MTDTIARNWSGNIAYGAREFARPGTVAELQEVVARAERVKPLGSRHSFSTVADTSGVSVSTGDLDLEVSFEGDVAVVPGGRRYGEIIPVLAAQGRALANLGSLPHISVAGAAATGTHGSGSGNRCLATHAEAVEFVRADGSLDVVRRGDEDFAGSVVALGALGVVTRMWLRTEPAFRMRQDVWVDIPLATVVDNLDDIMDSAYSVSVFRRPGENAQIWAKSRVDGSRPDGRRWGGRPAEGPMHPIIGEDPAATSPQLGQERAWHEVLPHFRIEFTPSNGEELQSEFFVPRAMGPDALAAFLALDLGDLVQVVELRTVAADELWVSPAYQRDNFAIHLTWVLDEPAVREACARIEAALAPFEYRPHWGKVFTAGRDELHAAHPRLADFVTLAARVDAERCFANDYLDRLVY